MEQEDIRLRQGGGVAGLVWRATGVGRRLAVRRAHAVAGAVLGEGGLQRLSVGEEGEGQQGGGDGGELHVCCGFEVLRTFFDIRYALKVVG